MKIALQPFPGSYGVTVLVPPIMAALYCINHGAAHCLGSIPNGPVAFAVFIDAPDTVEAASEYTLANLEEIVAQARRLMVTSVFLN